MKIHTNHLRGISNSYAALPPCFSFTAGWKWSFERWFAVFSFTPLCFGTYQSVQQTFCIAFTVSWCFADQKQRNGELDDALRSFSILLFMSPSICHNCSNASFIKVECRLLAGVSASPFQELHKQLAANGVKSCSLLISITQIGKAQ